MAKQKGKSKLERFTDTYIVLIEWDGKKAPSKWYRYLHKLGGRIRGGDMTLDPRERRQAMYEQAVEEQNKRARAINHAHKRKGRRANYATATEERGEIFQEGAIVCETESRAATLQALATELGARSTVMFKATAFEGDSVAANKGAARIKAILGRRGRPEDNSNWSILCLEHLGIESEESTGVIACPKCGGVNIRVREGNPRTFSDPNGDLVDAWVRLRFFEGRYEICKVDEAASVPPALSVTAALITEAAESAGVDLLRQSVDLKFIGTLPREQGMRVLDAMFVARVYNTEKLNKSRVEAVTKYMVNGGNPSRVRLDVPPTPDVLDAAAVLGADFAAGLALKRNK